MAGIVVSQKFNTLLNLFFRTIFPIAQMVKNLPAMQEAQVRSVGWEDLLEKGMGIHSSILAWRTMDRGAYRATGRKELDTTEWLTLLLLKQPYEVGINKNPHFTNQEMDC